MSYHDNDHYNSCIPIEGDARLIDAPPKLSSGKESKQKERKNDRNLCESNSRHKKGKSEQRHAKSINSEDSEDNLIEVEGNFRVLRI